MTDDDIKQLARLVRKLIHASVTGWETNEDAAAINAVGDLCKLLRAARPDYPIHKFCTAASPSSAHQAKMTTAAERCKASRVKPQ